MIRCPKCDEELEVQEADPDVGNLRAKLDIAISALEFARDGYERIDIKHIEYRVGVYTTACDALDKIALPSISNHQPHAVSQAAAFVAWAMREGSWDGGDLDGGALQDKAEELGLIIKTAYDPDIHGPSDYGAEPGDDWFVLHPDIEAASRPLHARPSPAKTGGAE